MLKVNGYQIATDKITYIEPERTFRNTEKWPDMSKHRLLRVHFTGDGDTLDLIDRDIDAFQEALEGVDRQAQTDNIPF